MNRTFTAPLYNTIITDETLDEMKVVPIAQVTLADVVAW